MLNESSKPDIRRLTRAVLAASERCHREIADAVHGTLCQTLGGAAFMVEVLATSLKAGAPVEADELDDLHEMLNRALGEARHVFNQLQPLTPGGDGLMTALSRLAADTTGRVRCEFECENAVLIDNPEAALSLYRVVYEAVNHALKRSQARHIKISLETSDTVISLKISDDGDFTSESHGTGVSEVDLMKFRAQIAGGSLTSESAPGRGTTVTYNLPKAAARPG